MAYTKAMRSLLLVTPTKTLLLSCTWSENRMKLSENWSLVLRRRWQSSFFTVFHAGSLRHSLLWCFSRVLMWTVASSSLFSLRLRQLLPAPFYPTPSLLKTTWRRSCILSSLPRWDIATNQTRLIQLTVHHPFCILVLLQPVLPRLMHLMNVA